MGIDAEMLIIVRGEKPSEKQIAKWADALCRSIGAEKFFVADGVSSAEYEPAFEKWRKDFNAHPFCATWKTTGDGDVHQKILDDIGKPPEELRRAISLSRYYGEEDPDVPLPNRQEGKCWFQDGDTKYAQPDEWFLEVSLWTRWYGAGYERGDLLTLCAVAEWFEANIPGCEVWYGGDSSGVCVEPWPEAARTLLRRHYYSEQGRHYVNSSDGFGSSSVRPKPCGLCVGGANMNQYGSGGNYVAVHCGGCGKNFVTRDNGATWSEDKERG